MLVDMQEALQFAFMQNAFKAGLLVSLAAGIIGSYVVITRTVFISGGVAHAAYGGIGISYYFGHNPVVGAMLFALAAAMGMGVIQKKTRQRSDTLIGVMWAVGMALGIILIDMTEGYKADLMSYLFGSILAVPESDINIMLILDAAILVMVALLYKELLAISFDETYAQTRSLPVLALYLVLLLFIALTVVMMMRVVGLIMVIALLTIPAAISGMFMHELRRMMLLSAVLATAFTFTGLWLSYFYDLTSGATIIMVAGAAYVLSLGAKTFVRAAGQQSKMVRRF
jgi:zinc transport system permease protein